MHIKITYTMNKSLIKINLPSINSVCMLSNASAIYNICTNLLCRKFFLITDIMQISYYSLCNIVS